MKNFITFADTDNHTRYSELFLPAAASGKGVMMTYHSGKGVMMTYHSGKGVMMTYPHGEVDGGKHGAEVYGGERKTTHGEQVFQVIAGTPQEGEATTQNGRKVTAEANTL